MGDGRLKIKQKMKEDNTIEYLDKEAKEKKRGERKERSSHLQAQASS